MDGIGFLFGHKSNFLSFGFQSVHVLGHWQALAEGEREVAGIGR